MTPCGAARFPGVKTFTLAAAALVPAVLGASRPAAPARTAVNARRSRLVLAVTRGDDALDPA